MKTFYPLFAMAFAATGAMAGNWTAPVPRTSSDFTTSVAEADTIYYYLLNKEHQQFLTQGAAWGTMATLDSLGTNPFKYAIFNDESGYKLYSPNAKSQGLLFRTSNRDVYTDFKNATGQAPYWSIQKTEEGTFRLSTSVNDPVWTSGATWVADGRKDYLFGWDPEGQDMDKDYKPVETNQAVYMLDPETEGAAFDWNFVSAADYAQYTALKELYVYLNKAEEAGVPTAAAESVYNNETATVEDIEAAVATLKTAIENSIYAQASEENPVDITELKVANADFSNGSRDPWVSKNNVLVYSSETLPNEKCTATEYNNGETFTKAIAAWIASTTHVEDDVLSQTITNLPAGKYTLSCSMVAQHGADMPKGVFIFANGVTENKTEFTHDPDQWAMAVADNKNNQQIEHPEVTIVHAGGEMTIGIEVVNTNCNWIYADNFVLKYYGPTTDNPFLLALKGVVNEATPYLDEYYSSAVAAELANIINEANAMMAQQTSDEDLQAEFDKLKKYLEVVKADIQAYADCAVLINTIEDDMAKYLEADLTVMLIGDPENGVIGLGDLADEIQAGYDNKELTVEQINKYITEYPDILNTLLALAMKDATLDNAIEVTSLYVKNADFSDGKLDPWTSKNGKFGYSGDTNPNGDCNVTDYNNGETLSKIVNAWRSSKEGGLEDDEVSQTIADVPAGAYVLSCSMVAQHGSDTPEGVYLFSTDDVDVQTLCEHDDAELWQQLVDAGTTNQLIMHPKHMFYHFGGPLTLGFRTIGTNCNWIYADNFTLSYAGESVEAMLQSLDAMIEQAYGLLEAQEGVHITDQAYEDLGNVVESMNNVDRGDADAVKEAMLKLQGAMKNALDGDKMWHELFDLFNSYDYIRTAIADESTLDANADFLTSMGALNQKFQANADFDSNEEIQGYLDNLPLQFTAYVQSGENATATEEAPKNISDAILNHNFEGYGLGDLLAFWNCTRTGAKDMDVKVGIAESYDNDTFEINQTIQGLKPGYYKVRCQGFYRAGDNKVNAAAYTANPDSVNTATFFANGSEKPLMNQVAHGYDGYIVYQENKDEPVVTVGETEIYVPNTREVLEYYFEEDLYWNEIDAYVDEDGILKIGIKKDVHVASDWCPFDNFELYYLGDSCTGIESVEAENKATVMSVGIYSLDGTRQSRLLKGVNIIKTVKADGTVEVRKLLVR